MVSRPINRAVTAAKILAESAKKRLKCQLNLEGSANGTVATLMITL